MDAKTKEEEQLLQDASTLLMFANVAAKQQQEQRRHSPPLPFLNKQVVTQIINPPDSKNVNYTGKTTGSSASIAGIMNNPIDHGYNSGIYNSPVQLHVPVPNRDDIKQVIKPMEHEAVIDTTKQPHSALSTNINVSPVIPKLSNLNGKSEPELHSRIGSNTPPEMITLSQAQSTHIKSETKNSSVTSGEPNKESLPLKGSFIPSLKLSPSEPPVEGQSHPNLYNHHHSPGPANVALARGINLETGERNSNNAVIAAAALAAAADIPLPLKRSDISDNKNIKSPLVIKEQIKNIDNPSTEMDDDDNDKTEDEATKPQNEDNDHNQVKNELTKELTKEPIVEKIKLSSYQVDPDSGIIGCLCEIDDDDGFTIQCDVCYRWQHCLCMGFKTNEEVPEDEYKCYLCDEAKRGKFNKIQCRINTLKRLGIEGTDQTDSVVSNNSCSEDISSKRKNSTDIKSDKNDKKRRLDNHNKNSSSQSLSSLKQNENLRSIPENLPNKGNILLDDGISAENYQTVYYKLSKNDYKNESIKELFNQLGNKFMSLTKNNKRDDISTMSLKEYKSIKFCNIILPNQLKYLQENKDFKKINSSNKLLNIQVKSYADTFKQKFNGIAKLGLFISSSKSTNREIIIPKETPIIEYLGEIDLLEKYVNDSINQYDVWGTTKPKVLKQGIDLVDKKLDIVIDSRFVGNESRFIRNSCPFTSNCKIKVVYVPEQNSFKFLVVTSKDIKLTDDETEEELRLPWNWDSNHPIRKFYDQENLKFDMLNNDEKAFLISNIDKILHFIECGCSSTSSNSSCAIFKVKKATSYLLRSTRKVSLISNVNLTKSKDELIAPKKVKHFISWNERLAKRDKIIQMNLSVTTDEKEIEEIGESNTLDNAPRTISDKSNLFKVPYKKQILAQIRGNQVKKEIGKIEYIPLEGDLPIPIIPQLSSKIEEKLNKKLNVDKIIPEDISKSSNEPIKNVVDISTKEKGNLDETPIVSNNPLSNNTNVNIAPPPVKKKLSFADYKKKMK